MTEISDTIVEYRHSCEMLKKRIEEINARISSRADAADGETIKTLENRRYLLYSELGDMEMAMHSLEDYVRQLPPRQRRATYRERT